MSDRPAPKTAGGTIQSLGRLDPQYAFACLADQPGLAFLDSHGPAGDRARHSTLALMPRARLVANEGDDDIWPTLRHMLSLLREHQATHMPPVLVADAQGFHGGVIGYLGFGLASTLENVAINRKASLGLPDAVLHAYDTFISFDRESRQARLHAGGPDGRPRAAMIRKLIARGPQIAKLTPVSFTEETPREAYLEAVSRIIAYIRAGDIFQANFTARLLAARPRGFSPAAAYLALRQASPAPFSAYLDLGDGCAIASVSPERFVHLGRDGQISSRPIKGTIARGATDDEDRALAASLAGSAKDRAENLMITDLLRNDLTRVAGAGSVQVPRLCEIEQFANVTHMVSEITAALEPGRDAVDLLRAVFPGGSVTGAPKIRAIDIIAEVETAERGPYCGSVVALGTDGSLDSSIIIRTAVIGQQTIALQAGGGIVADSDPAAEYDEMRLKIAPMLAALSGTRK